jgi:hypothetical protein
MELLSPEDRYWVWQRVDDMLGISWNIPYNKILTMYIQRTLPPFVITLMKRRELTSHERMRRAKADYCAARQRIPATDHRSPVHRVILRRYGATQGPGA